MACPSGGLAIQFATPTVAETAVRGIWDYETSGTLTNGYRHAVSFSDTNPPRVHGLDSTRYEVVLMDSGRYAHAGDAGFLTLAPGESIGFTLSEPSMPYDPSTVATWAPDKVPETTMTMSWYGADWQTLTRACGYPGGWHF